LFLTRGFQKESILNPIVKEASQMLRHLLVLPILIGLPISGFAKFSDKGEYVEVKKGTKLCSNVEREREKGSQYPGREFWIVTSNMRSNHTQTVESLTQEIAYEPESGEMRRSERKSRESYATFFKKDPKHKGMLLMISPDDGSVEATVGVCGKKK
jgi:hypothetical protein